MYESLLHDAQPVCILHVSADAAVVVRQLGRVFVETAVQFDDIRVLPSDSCSACETGPG